MHVEPPIRAANARGKTVPSPSRASLGQREDSVAHAWNKVSSPREDLARGSDGHGTDREERLLRMVDILRTEQVSASIVAEKEVGRAGFHRWHGLGLWVIIFILLGAAALFLIFRPTHVYSDVRVDSVPESAHPMPLEPIAKVIQPQPRDSLGAFPEHAQSLPMTEHQETKRSDIAEAATSLAGTTAETDPVDLPTPRPEANMPANPALAAVTGGVSRSNTNKPAVLVYFPHGSSRAETNARSLPARIGVDMAIFDSESKSALPDDAVIKFSAESNHALARTVGKSLGDLGYRWRIENSPDLVVAHRNLIEVWLPR